MSMEENMVKNAIIMMNRKMPVTEFLSGSVDLEMWCSRFGMYQDWLFTVEQTCLY